MSSVFIEWKKKVEEFVQFTRSAASTASLSPTPPPQIAELRSQLEDGATPPIATA